MTSSLSSLSTPIENGNANHTEVVPVRWNELLGLTAAGQCVRHPTISLLSSASDGYGDTDINKSITGCPACEELSISSTALVDALRKLKNDASLSADDDAAVASSSSTDKDGNNAPLTLHPSLNDESVLKRLVQVQNWVLQAEQTKVCSLQKQTTKMEQQLADAQQTVLEQQQTIRALRRTIQQDLKLIKTMAEQKQQEIAQQQMQEDEHSDHSMERSPSTSPMKLYGSPPKRTGRAGGGVYPSPLDSGSSHSSISASPNPRLAAQLQFFQRAARARRNSGQHHHPQQQHGIPEETATPTYEEEIGFQPTPVERSSSSYWHEDSVSLASNPSKLFASFRGGLLDIPKSPPPPSHDSSAKRPANAVRSKIQLKAEQVSALQMPERGLMRSNSMEGNEVLSGMPTQPPRPGGRRKKPPAPKQEIPLGQLANQLTALPLSTRKLGDQSPEQFFPESVNAEAAKSTLQAPPFSLGSVHKNTGRGASPQTKTKKPVVPVFGAASKMSLLDGSESSSSSNALGKFGVDKFGVSVLTMSSTSSPKGAPAPSTVAPQSAPTQQQQQQQKQQQQAMDAAVSAVVTTSASKKATPPSSGINNLSHVETTEDVAPSSSQQQQQQEKFLFSVTAAECQDRYGDVGMYTGTILVTEGLPHGFGTMNYESGRVYSGEWMSGQWNGKGKLLNPNGDTYEGQFVFDARHGKGVYRWDNGDVYTGSFWQDQRHGQGKFCFHNGNVYEGEFCDGMFEGHGRYEFDGGVYEGDWKEGRYHGHGELTYTNGAKYTGEFRNSVAHGFGSEVTADGKTRRGVWENGQPVDA